MSERAKQDAESPEEAAARRARNLGAPLSSYLKWSALMVAGVALLGVVAARVIHALGLD